MNETNSARWTVLQGTGESEPKKPKDSRAVFLPPSSFSLPPCLRRSLVAGSAFALWCATAFGQAQNDPLKVQRGAQGGPPPPVIQQQQRPFYVQAAVVVLLSGGAVWTVCRSSRRQ